MFKFKIYSMNNLKSLEMFFDNWKGRHPMFLQIIPDPIQVEIDKFTNNLIEKYWKIYFLSIN